MIDLDDLVAARPDVEPLTANDRSALHDAVFTGQKGGAHLASPPRRWIAGAAAVGLVAVSGLVMTELLARDDVAPAPLDTSTIEELPTVPVDTPAPIVPTSVASSPPSTSAAATTATPVSTTVPAGPVDFLAIGDSVMLGAAVELAARGYVVDAAASRNMVDVVPLVSELAAAGVLGDPIVIHLGTNGPIDQASLDELRVAVADVPNVIMLNARADRSWIEANNALLDEFDRPDDNIVLIDWNTLGDRCTGDCYAADGIHLRVDGARYYADVIGQLTGR